MKIHLLTADQALANLHTRAEGLSAEEARRRLREFGANRIERVRSEHGWRRLWAGFTHFLALILWLAAGLAFFAEYREPGQGMAMLGFAILGVILINGLFSFWQEHRAELALAALQKLLPHQVKVARDSALMTLPAAELVPGDIVLLEAGDDIPADCRVLEAFSARVDNATITGESVPLPATPGPPPSRTCCTRATSCSPAPRSCQARPARWPTRPACAPSSAASPDSPSTRIRQRRRCSAKSRA